MDTVGHSFFAGIMSCGSMGRLCVLWIAPSISLLHMSVEYAPTCYLYDILVALLCCMHGRGIATVFFKDFVTFLALLSILSHSL